MLRRQSRPRAKSFRPAERYLIAAAAHARRLGHHYIGTEHLLLGLLRTDPNAATGLLRRLDVHPAAVADALHDRLGEGQPTIDPTALATLGIDYDAVVGRLHTARIHTLTVTPPSLDALFLRTYDGQAVPLDATERGEPEEAR